MTEPSAFLVSVSRSTQAVVLAARGSTAQFEAREVGVYADDIFPSREIPSGPGIYVWEGTITSTFCGPDDCPDIDYDGSFRPATPEDVAGLLACEPADKEDD